MTSPLLNMLGFIQSQLFSFLNSSGRVIHLNEYKLASTSIAKHGNPNDFQRQSWIRSQRTIFLHC